ncbi:MAG TPA: TIGR03435 family protein [Vicinamibacterales bacterium]|nr:TIGR03435 family protein [Vicinamibacterales bacterium]
MLRILIAALFASHVLAAQDHELRFADADIHESTGNEDQRGRAEFLPSGDFTASRQSVRQLIARAYALRESQVVDVPDALADARFDIYARAPEAASAFDGPKMLRRLLADRFGLVVRDEQRKQPAYTLSRSGRRLGRRLHEATAHCTPMPGSVIDTTREPSNDVNECRQAFGWNGSTIYIRQSRIADLVRLLELELRSTVVDRSGLTGKYDPTCSPQASVPAGRSRPPVCWTTRCSKRSATSSVSS